MWDLGGQGTRRGGGWFQGPKATTSHSETEDKELESRLMMPHSFWAAFLGFAWACFHSYTYDYLLKIFACPQIGTALLHCSNFLKTLSLPPSWQTSLEVPGPHRLRPRNCAHKAPMSWARRASARGSGSGWVDSEVRS